MAKKIELSTQPGWNSSARWLTSTHLAVDWCSYGNLFYRMTKQELRKVLRGADEARTIARPAEEKFNRQSFKVKRTRTTLSIGCERFNASDLKLMKKWCAR